VRRRLILLRPDAFAAADVIVHRSINRAVSYYGMAEKTLDEEGSNRPLATSHQTLKMLALVPSQCHAIAYIHGDL
jgi:hypothetical protein